MAFDTRDRLFVSSDASGEIYVVVRGQGSNGTNDTYVGRYIDSRMIMNSMIYLNSGSGGLL